MIGTGIMGGGIMGGHVKMEVVVLGADDDASEARLKYSVVFMERTSSPLTRQT